MKPINDTRPLRLVGRDDMQTAEMRARRERCEAAERKRQERDEQMKRAREAELSKRIDARLRRELTKCPSPCGLVMGPTGIGKSSAADMIAIRNPGFFIHARELASAERRHSLGAGYAPEIARAREARVLYIDDVGAEEQRDVGVLQEVIDHRYRKGLATFVTTGLRQSELQDRIGAAYIRRLAEQHVKHINGAEHERRAVEWCTQRTDRADDPEWPVLFVEMFSAVKR